MIIKNGIKDKVIFDGGQRIYAIFHGYDLIYNCYAIPEEVSVIIRCDGGVEKCNIKSNSNWKIVFN